MDNTPAFPTGTGWNHDGEWVGGGDDGMTLRDYFAAKAMQAMLGMYNKGDKFELYPFAVASYQMADTMMEARNKQ